MVTKGKKGLLHLFSCYLFFNDKARQFQDHKLTQSLYPLPTNTLKNK